ncbi:MAG: hypothetical protein ACREGD_01320 [Candidatus Saccharimonadales bacterium]
MRKENPIKIRYLGWGATCLGLLLALVPPLGAQGVSSIAQGFQTTDANIVAGALVSLKSDTPNSVELASPEKADQLIGIVGKDPLIGLSDGNNSVQVVTSGVTMALVSDINGGIKSGDKITASPIEGVGMRATQTGLVVGTAQASLDDVTTNERSIADKQGQQQTVKIGLVPVQVDTVFFAGVASGSSFVPSVLQDLANSIAGREVSAVRILVAALLLILLLVSVVALIYSSVRSSIISIGRNPLSENAVQKSLLQVMLTTIGLLAFTVILVYLILTL